MAKPKSLYVCTECGGQTLKWQGQCPHCNAWNTLVETVAEKSVPRYQGVAQTSRLQKMSQVDAREEPRRQTGIDELDRVLGGWLVRGAVVLLGGDPGIGKSTLLLQALSVMSGNCRAVYVSGEESAQQIALRARRLGAEASALDFLAEIQLEKILSVLSAQIPDVAVIDSIQTVYAEALQSAPGSVAQVRECAAQLTRFAKNSGTALILVGHVTKEGALAGPRVLEHMVDAVL
ncbi:MAG: AAA family ATPase, partial [Burkholderiales bacterium]